MPDIFDASARKNSNLTAVNEDVDVAEKAEAEKVNAAVGTSDSGSDTSTRVAKSVDDYSMVMRQEPPSDNPFKSFVAKPEKISFASQHFEEKVLLLLRQHPVTQLHWMLIAIVLALLPFLFKSVGLLDFLPPNYEFAATVGWYLLLLGYALQAFLSWFYNVYIVTDERIVDVDFTNLLYKNISSAKIDRIEDVTTISGGLLSSFFDFGTVKIQTAAAEEEFEFENVPQPAKVTAFLNEMIVEEEKEKFEGRVN